MTEVFDVSFLNEAVKGGRKEKGKGKGKGGRAVIEDAA